MMRIPASVVLLGTASFALAQDAPTPIFQAGTKLVEVEVVAKSHGAPAKGLKKEDFTLTDNGKRQNIAFFSVRSVTTLRSNVTEKPLPAGTYSNRLAHDSESAARTTVILLDQMNTPQELQGYVIPRIKTYVETPHGPDRLAIY